jgi:protein TonB
MKTNVVLRVIAPLLSVLTVFSAAAQEEPEPAKAKGADSLSHMETMPSFPGGMKAMHEYLNKNLQYPQEALDIGLEGKCHLAFTVTAEGKIVDVEVRRGVPDCPECDKEAVRLFRSMPDWIPATVDGVPGQMHLQLPFWFHLR